MKSVRGSGRRRDGPSLHPDFSSKTQNRQPQGKTWQAAPTRTSPKAQEQIRCGGDGGVNLAFSHPWAPACALRVQGPRVWDQKQISGDGGKSCRIKTPGFSWVGRGLTACKPAWTSRQPRVSGITLWTRLPPRPSACHQKLHKHRQPRQGQWTPVPSRDHGSTSLHVDPGDQPCGQVSLDW